jgi:hypothetical protein
MELQLIAVGIGTACGAQITPEVCSTIREITHTAARDLGEFARDYAGAFSSEGMGSTR